MPIVSLSDVAEHQFRSLEEVERYVNDLSLKIKEHLNLLNRYEVQFAKTEVTAAIEFKINVDKSGKLMKKRKGSQIAVQKFKKIVIPDAAKLQKNFAIVDELFDDLDKLKTVESIVSVNFRHKPGAGQMIEGIRTRRKITENGIKKAREFLTQVGAKYEPTEFKEFVQNVADVLSKNLDYDDYENSVYVTPNGPAGFRFTHYIRLIGLEDDDGNTFPELYLVFTCLLSPLGSKKVEAEYFVNVLYEFQTPGKFETGTEVDSVKGAILVLGSILDNENFANRLGTLPLNLEDTKIKKDQFSVKGKIFSFEVGDKTLTFNLLKGVSQSDAEDVVKKLYIDVKGLLYKTRAKLRIRGPYKEGGRFKIVFTLANLAKDGQVSVDEMAWLKEMIGVDDEKIRRIVRIINGG